MSSKIKYKFSTKVWKHSESPRAWYFMSLPKKLSSEIRKNLKWQEEGWGRIKAGAQIGNTHWDTAIWFDTKRKTYLLPIKAEIRKKERIEKGMSIQCVVLI